jgi:poly-beta-1,6-N-acetyl-D-glucosamine synthase
MVRRHPPQANLFTAMLAVLLLEFITASTIFVILPVIAGILAIPDVAPSALHWAPMADVHTAVAAHMNLTAVVFGVALPDYVMTCLVAVMHRRARLLFLGLFFPLVRVIDSAISLSALAVAWFARSNGTWKSPPRRAIDTPPPLPVPATAPGARIAATRPESPLPSEYSPDYRGERGHAS